MAVLRTGFLAHGLFKVRQVLGAVLLITGDRRENTGARLQVSGVGLRVSGSTFRVPGSGFRVSGFGFRISGLGCGRKIFPSRGSVAPFLSPIMYLLISFRKPAPPKNRQLNVHYY